MKNDTRPMKVGAADDANEKEERPSISVAGDSVVRCTPFLRTQRSAADFLGPPRALFCAGLLQGSARANFKAGFP